MCNETRYLTGEQKMGMHNPARTVSNSFAAGSRLKVNAILALTLSLLPLPPAMAQDPHEHHHHAMSMTRDSFVRTQVNYTVPDVKLLDADGAALSLRSRLDGKPVILNFIFTSCGAICPVMSSIFSQVQTALGRERDEVRMVSISIDPEHDTPGALKSYAKKYAAGPQWQMLTGSIDNSIAVQRAFDVYRGDKMGHTPVTFLRAKAGQSWVRLDGFASADDIVREYRQLASR
jgi:protein SCO1